MSTPRPAAPLVIGHRGAPGYRPEHTLAAYELAIRMGADAVEPDLVVTRDGVLVARHENEIGGTTDVAAHPEFAGRRTTKVVDGEELTGWFTEDFTLAELRTLRATERLGDLRPTNRLYDGRWPVVTLEEVVALVRGEARRAGRPVGLVLELKHSAYFAALGLALEPLLLETLERVGLGPADPAVPVWVESFETTNLRWLAPRCEHTLVQLAESHGCPQDSSTPYARLLSPAGLTEVAGYASGVAVRTQQVVSGVPGTAPTALVADAHAAGLTCWVYTVRPENTFLPVALRRGSEPAGHGDVDALVRELDEAGVDGLFSDVPDLTVAALAAARALPAAAGAGQTRVSRGTRTHATR